jgi:GH15 family glucan-1,4-alpha-glucosidase
VADAAWQYTQQGGRLDRDSRKLLAGIGKTVCARWREPDNGIWEKRGALQHYTHSKVLGWVALDRLLRLHDEVDLDVPAAHLRTERDALRTAIEQHGYNERLASYTQTFDGGEPDASLLTLPLYDYLEATHPRMRSTREHIQQILGRDALVYRYRKGDAGTQPAREGAFGLCSFWMVECQALAGDVAGATRRFEQLLGYANDVNLYAEETDPATGAALGNFPQAFTHVGLINAALTLQTLLSQSSQPAARSPQPTETP